MEVCTPGNELEADAWAKALVLGEASEVDWPRLARALVTILGLTRKALDVGIKLFS